MQLKASILILSILPVNLLAQADINDAELKRTTDYSRILTEAFSVEIVDQPTIEWGRGVLAGMGIEDLEPDVKAAAILQFIHNNFCFEGNYPPTVAAFVEERRGNCLAHAKLGIFLLRLACVPAKLAWESHLTMSGAAAGRIAREHNKGQFGAFHNAHVWVFYYDGELWQPFDSGFGYLGYDSFVEARWVFRPGKVFGPPFVIWESTGFGFVNMKNVTEKIWSRCNLPEQNGITGRMWLDFVAGFGDLSRDRALKLLPEELLDKIETMCKFYFKPFPIAISDVPEELRPYFSEFDSDGDFYHVYHYSVSGLGRHVFDTEKRENGERILKIAIDADPDSTWLRNTLGRMYCDWGKREKAIQTYSDTLSIDPDNVNARIELELLTSNK